MTANVLGIFVKQPVPGRVKTRLAADVGPEPAAALYASFTRDIVTRMQSVPARRVLCHAPGDDAARAHFAGVAGTDVALWPQPESPLGTRLSRFFEERFAAGTERVVVIGSDSPTLPASHVEAAFDLLADRDCVLGPATDGGYYLVGLRRSLPIFDEIPWSTADVLAETIGKLQSSGDATLGLLPPWYDVDDRDGLSLLRGHLAALEAAGEGDAAPATRDQLRLV